MAGFILSTTFFVAEIPSQRDSAECQLLTIASILNFYPPKY